MMGGGRGSTRCRVAGLVGLVGPFSRTRGRGVTAVGDDDDDGRSVVCISPRVGGLGGGSGGPAAAPAGLQSEKNADRRVVDVRVGSKSPDWNVIDTAIMSDDVADVAFDSPIATGMSYNEL